jgi:hypothetical protein
MPVEIQSERGTRQKSPSLAHGSRIEPIFEVNLEALKHLFFNVFDVDELTPTSYIAVFRGALNLHNELFHQPQLVPVFFPEMLFANVRSLFLPVLGLIP